MEQSKNNNSSLVLAITAPSLELVLEQISSSSSFTEDDLHLFDSYIASKPLSQAEIGPVLEAYLKIAGVMDLFNSQCSNNCFSVRYDHNSEIPSQIKRVFNHKGFIYETARKIDNDDMGGTPLSILAHTVYFYTEVFDLIFNKASAESLSSIVLYTGSYEIYFIIEYIATSSISTSSISTSDNFSLSLNESVVANWAKHCNVPFSGMLFSLSCEAFFDRELIHSRSINSIIFAIIIKKSHKLLLDRINLILRNKQPLRTAISLYLMTYKVKNPANNSLLSLLLLSFNELGLEHTEEILIRINDEFITKQFIIKTSKPLKCFFQICYKIDECFMKCIKICSKFIEEIRNAVLNEMVRSKAFKIRNYEFFKKIVEILHRRNIEIPVERLLQVNKKRKRCRCDTSGNKPTQKDPINSLTDALLELKLSSSERLIAPDWRIELICRILYVIDHCKPSVSYLPFVNKAISWKYPELSIRLIFKMASYKTFKRFILRRGSYPVEQVIFQELSTIDYSMFYFRVCRFIKRFCSSQLLMSRLDTSPFALAIRHKLNSENPIKAPEIEKGLYFNHGTLKILNLYKKFVLGIKQLLFIEYLNDMSLVRLSHGLTATEIRIDSGDLKVITEVSKPFCDIQTHSYIISSLNDIIKSPEAAESSERPATLMIEIHINCDKCLRIQINSRVVEIKIPSPTEIEISENFYGVLKGLVYAETLESEPRFFSPREEDTFTGLMEYTNDFIVPVSRLLSYKNRKGVIIGWRRPLFLGNSGNGEFIKIKNSLGVF